jgi:hypothetical protein
MEDLPGSMLAGPLIAGFTWAARTGARSAQWALNNILGLAGRFGLGAREIREAYNRYGLLGGVGEFGLLSLDAVLAALPTIGRVGTGLGATAAVGSIALYTGGQLVSGAQDLLQYMTSTESAAVPEAVKAEVVQAAKQVVDDIGGGGALGSGMASIIGEKFIDPPEINYEGLPQQTYTTGFPAHMGLRGVGSGAMQHKTDGDLVFNPGMRKSTAVTPYNSNATMEKLNKRTTTPNVSAH